MPNVLLIGLDAASFNYLDPWFAAGELPNLAQLMAQAARGILRSTIPPVTSVAWTSMVTGLDPGRFGLYDVVARRGYAYEFIPATFLNTHQRALWDLLSQGGRRVAVIGVPSTYPASPVNGVMLTGFDSPQYGERLTYPPDLLDRLACVGLKYPWEALTNLLELERRRVVGDRLDDYIAHWRTLTQAKGNITRWLLTSEPFDFFMVVFSSTDHIVHHTSHRDIVLQVYRHVDEAIGHILEAVDLNTTWVILASDHGSTETDYLVTLYRLLHEHGWLDFRDELAVENLQWILLRTVPRLEKSVVRLWQILPSMIRHIFSWPLAHLDPRLQSTYSNIDWSRTRVYAPSSHGPLYLNVRGREPQGIVEPGAPYERLRDEVIAALLEARDSNTGRPLFAWVRRGEEVYQGPYATPPPDLVFEPADWRYKVVTGFHSHPLVRPNRHRRVGYVEHGWHTPWGIVALTGPGVRPGTLEEASITDIAPTVLYLLDEPIPDDLNGEVLQTAFTSEWQSTHSVIKRPFVSITGQQERLEEGEIAIVEDRLRSLGYLV